MIEIWSSKNENWVKEGEFLPSQMNQILVMATSLSKIGLVKIKHV